VRVFNRYRSTVIAVVGVIFLLQIPVQAASVIFSAAGSGPAGIQATVDNFRNAVGNPNNGNAPGPLASGRREINWDGGGTANTLSPTPFSGFQDIRGALFSTPGSGFLQAPAAAGGLDVAFGNPAYAGLFSTFSPQRVFTPVGSNITDVTFFIPGSGGGSPATVTAFGAVFSDVDLPNVTSMQFFDINGASLGTFFVPALAGTAQSQSFLGVLFDAGERISRVRIITGNAALSGSALNGGGTDLVVMDDFIYSEPQAVPETSAIVLLGTGLVALGFGLMRRRRK
jgi:hypothetical protein